MIRKEEHSGHQARLSVLLGMHIPLLPHTTRGLLGRPPYQSVGRLCPNNSSIACRGVEVSARIPSPGSARSRHFCCYWLSRQPPPGVEEARWLTLRKLCLCLAGAKTKDLLRGAYRGGDGGGGGGARGGVDDGGGGGGVDLMGALQEVLVRSLCGSRPEAKV